MGEVVALFGAAGGAPPSAAQRAAFRLGMIRARVAGAADCLSGARAFGHAGAYERGLAAGLAIREGFHVLPAARSRRRRPW
ncbi:MAG TPA: hypothetical protein VFC47_11405 [Caulobacteraceae bacterium]|nr:hypothetical protein [Caulobacteraceae bacterium]